MTTSLSFSSLGLASPILLAVQKQGYTTPTPIQAECIPSIIQGKDLMGLAQTGTGKTAAFALPLLHKISEHPRRIRPHNCRALILCPTRELAMQIHDSLRKYGKNLEVTTAVIYGGVSYGPQLKALGRGVDILVATPGRLMDHMANHAVDLSSADMLILDEADRMLDMGFAPSIKKICAELPRNRQTLLFSATMPDAISKLAKALLNNPKTVSIVSEHRTADNIEQSLCHVHSQADKRQLTVDILEQTAYGLTLIFTRTRHGANRLAKHLSQSKIPASAIHGDKSQNARERALEAFRSGKTPVLVATDVAARGIDVKDIDLVINYDLSHEPEDYVHRIGRTARAGASGQAISFCAPEEVKQLRDLQNHLNVRLPLHPASQAPSIRFSQQENKTSKPGASRSRPQQNRRRRG